MLASHKVDIDGMRCTVQVFKNGMHKLLVGSEKRVFKYCGPDSGLEGKVRALLGSSSKQVSEQTAPALQSAAAALGQQQKIKETLTQVSMTKQRFIKSTK